jgi:hypothetical protein
MTDRPENPPAFPRPHSEDRFNEDAAAAQRGMTLRDYFAAAALTGHISCISGANLTSEKWHAEAARLSYQTADAMLKARES